MNQDIIEKLRIDPGKRTLGELIQDREAAAHEINRLRAQLERVSATRTKPRKETEPTNASPVSTRALIRLSDLCESLGVSRSTIYRWVAEDELPAPVRIGARALRWRSEDIEQWKSSLQGQETLRS